MAGHDARPFATVALGLVAAALVVVALLIALRPFGVTLDLRSGHAKPLAVSGTCDAAAKTAWNHDSKDKLRLWAVTVGTNMMGYTPVFGKHVKDVLVGAHEVGLGGHLPDAYCGGEARHRLIVSGALLATGALAVAGGVFVVRRRRTA